MHKHIESLSTTETRVIHVSEMDRFPDAVYIGRAMPRKGLKASPWRNPYKIGRDGDRQAVLRYYEADCHKFKYSLSDDLHLLPELRGKALACWCRRSDEERTPDNACHGDILVGLLERYTDDELRAFGVVAERNRPYVPGAKGQTR